MVYCCVPRCSSSKRIPPNVSFHTFPSNPDMAARWIKNINLFIPNGGTWFPQPGDLVCSKHFLPSDFKREMTTPSLKPHSIPTLFENSISVNEVNVVKRKKEESKSPLIVKVIKPTEDDSDDDSDMDDAPLTELFRPRKNSAPASSSFTAFPLEYNSPVRFTYITGPAEAKKSGNKQDSLDHSPNLGTASNSVTTVTNNGISKRTTQNSSESAKNHMNASVDHQSKQFVEPNPAKKQKLMTKNQPSKDVSSELIEIGPSTFLKINPDVIRVTKRVTPSGNTVLQFVMNPNLGVDAKNIFQTVGKTQALCSNENSPNTEAQSNGIGTTSDKEKSMQQPDNVPSEVDSMVPDTTCKDDLLCQVPEASAIAPAVLSTSLPVSHSYGLSWKQKHASAMRQKNRQIHALKAKYDKLLKRVDELETKCIVQERQLDFPSLKKLKAIKKNAEKGEPHACFILEQIRGYFGNIPLRWSESTMTQCSIWCRKAPYAYEYFKKADLFRLPCLGTVKRYMKKHPEITTQIKNRTLGVHALDSDDSSSDFDFDEDEEDMQNDEDSNDNVNHSAPRHVMLNDNDAFQTEEVSIIVPDSVPEERSEANFSSDATHFSVSSMPLSSQDSEPSKTSDPNGLDDSQNATIANGLSEPVTDEAATKPCENESSVDTTNDESSTVETSSNSIIVKTISDGELKSIYLPTSTHQGRIATMNLNGQEIILQPGNIIQLNSDLAGSSGIGNQFFVIPSAEDQTSGDHQYSIAQPVSFVIQQNGEDEEQVYYITQETSDIPEGVTVSAADSNV